MWFLKLLNPLSRIADKLIEWETRLADAKTERAKVEAEIRIAQLEAQQSVLIAEQSHWATRWIRPALAFPVVVYWWKIVVWDTVLQWGVTPYPGDHVAWFVVLIPSAYFLARAYEKRK